MGYIPRGCRFPRCCSSVNARLVDVVDLEYVGRQFEVTRGGVRVRILISLIPGFELLPRFSGLGVVKGLVMSWSCVIGLVSHLWVSRGKVLCLEVCLWKVGVADCLLEV